MNKAHPMGVFSGSSGALVVVIAPNDWNSLATTLEFVALFSGKFRVCQLDP